MMEQVYNVPVDIDGASGNTANTERGQQTQVYVVVLLEVTQGEDVALKVTHHYNIIES